MFLIRRVVLFALLFLGVQGTVFTQSITFQKTIGAPGDHRAHDIIETADGYLISGQTRPAGDGPTLGTLIRTDKQGQILWQKTYGGFEEANLRQVSVANDGGFIAWGDVRNTNQNRWEGWLLKVDDAGTLLWQKNIFMPGFNETALGEIVRVADGYILSGIQAIPGYSQSFVARVDNSGESVWSRFTPSSEYNALTVQYLADSMLYLSGVVNRLGCRRTMDPVSGTITGSLEYKVDTACGIYRLFPAPGGRQLMLGTATKYVPGLTRIDAWAQQVDSLGHVLWSKTLKANRVNTLSSATALPDGSVVYCTTVFPNGTGTSTTYQTALVKLDAGGQLVWARSFDTGRFSRLERILHTADGGFVAAGYRDRAVPGESEMFFLKTDSLGIVDGCCVADLALEVFDETPLELELPYIEEDFPLFNPFQLAEEGESNLQVADKCDNVQPVLQQTIPFCPGEGIVLGDSTYTQPGTVHLVLPSTTGGCDTAATYILELLPQPALQQSAFIGAGDSIAIAGQVYTEPGTVVVQLPATAGGCDTILTVTLLPDSLACPQSVSFLKRQQKNLVPSAGRIIVPAADGSLYIFGEIQGQQGPKILKTDVDGHVSMTRRLDFLAPDLPYNFSMIEDSEGRLVGFGNYSKDAAQDNAMYAFRYDPVADSVLWFQHFAANQACTATGLVEIAPGGNYLLYDFVQPDANTSNSEIWQLERSTGALVNGRVSRYDTKVRFRAAIVRGGAFYATGLYADPTNGLAGMGISKIDAAAGTHLWTQFMQTATTGLQGQDIGLDMNGDLITIANQNGRLWIQKSNIDGQPLWLRRYEVPDSLFQGLNSASLCLQPDGYVILGFTTRADGIKSMLLLKVDPDGALLWARELKYAGTGGADGARQTLTAQGNGLFFVAQYSRTPFSSDGMWFGKTDLSGHINDDCSGLSDVSVQVFDEAVVALPVTLIRIPPTRTLTAPMRTGVSAELPPFVTTCALCELPCQDEFVHQSIGLYPGQTVVLGGQPYGAPAVVTITIPKSGGCDSIVTYQLNVLSSQLLLDCPADIETVLPSGSATVSVSYATPVAVTDCPDGTIVLKRLQGPASGGDFPKGVTTVCYEAANACGVRDTCCFEVRVDEDAPACDTKTSGCLGFDVLKVNRDAAQHWIYRVRVTNHCSSAVQYVYLEIPDGVTALEPPGNMVYTAPDGEAYALRSPNFSPFYSLRFKPVASGLSPGQSAVFRYVLPAQTPMQYIHAAARLLNGGYLEVYLNTFNCPPGVETAQRSVSEKTPAPFTLSVAPNPAGAGARLQLQGGPISEGEFVLRDLTGRMVFRGVVSDSTVRLHEWTGAPGMYVFEVQANGQTLGVGKLVVF